MGSGVLRLVRHCAEFLPKAHISDVPHNTRGIYVLSCHDPKQGARAYNVVYIGMSRTGVRGRLASHRKSKRKSSLWTHFSVYEVWPNITDEEIIELEGLFRAIYRRDIRANSLAKQKGFARLHEVRSDKFKWD